jgi:hypothetical protein
MKLEISFTPSRPKTKLMITPSMNAGKAESIRDRASNPGVIQMFSRSQLVQFSVASLHDAGVEIRDRLFSGSAFRRMEDHQKYRLGMRWSWRFTDRES